MTETPPAGRERRQHPRAALDVPITISLSEGTYEARLRDVSRAGVCFFLDRRIPEMTVLRMDLDLPGDGDGRGREHVAGAGVVVRCRPLSPHVDHYEVAVFLNDVSEETRERLAAYTESHSSPPFSPS